MLAWAQILEDQQITDSRASSDSLLVAASAQLTGLSGLRKSLRGVASTNKTGEVRETDIGAGNVLDSLEGVHDTELVSATCR